MNLGKLLGAGKSVFGGQAPAEYRKSKHVYLPKFNAGKNPFSSKPSEPAAPVSAPAPTPAASKLVVAAPVVSAPVVPPPAVKPAAPVFSAPPTAAGAPVSVVAKPVAAKPARAAHWSERLNHLWAAAKQPKPAAAGPMPNVQPELLSLDAVKVVHNDLSDADVEVVPMKSRPAPAKSTPVPAVAMDFMNEPALKSA